ncbi:NeuD/PglB/VioB family sugar acetyltransferase [Flavobacterium sp. MK4S-17]|uniref:NeuD/PglB/VioB family sugar acetyltransferase n=1 Tax=Flavobacterium sp. MK4S-17 TaxID=2543737 RepID=UPI001356D402|nr:NeuD/PglB/VioB family sugar acetyltransferase [Flavobacterium sp. MK4S-17]
MAKKLLIIGAGNVGGYISYNIEDFGDYDVLGFLDDNPEKHGKIFYGREVLGAVSSIDNYLSDDLSVVIGIANPQAKKKTAELLSSKGLDFPNFISKNVWLSRQVSIGKGIILYPGVSVNYETEIQDFVIMNMNCAIGHNCTISRFSSLAPGVNLAGFTKLGEGVDMGIGASTRQGVVVGNNSLVGGQAMLVKNIEENVKVKGVPAAEF